jgi:hypothetical protein
MKAEFLWEVPWTLNLIAVIDIGAGLALRFGSGWINVSLCFLPIPSMIYHCISINQITVIQ